MEEAENESTDAIVQTTQLDIPLNRQKSGTRGDGDRYAYCLAEPQIRHEGHRTPERGPQGL